VRRRLQVSQMVGGASDTSGRELAREAKLQLERIFATAVRLSRLIEAPWPPFASECQRF
jgi:hypothetical protein